MDYTMTSAITICRKREQLPSTWLMEWTYNNTARDSQLRKFIAQTFVHVLHQGENEDKDWSLKELYEAISTNEDLRMDVLTLLRKENAWRMMSKSPDELDFYTFRNHKKGEVYLYNKGVL